MSAGHACPGGCGTAVPYVKLACLQCWSRLPKPLRDEVNAVWRQRNSHLSRHLQAVSAALRWYRDERSAP